MKCLLGTSMASGVISQGMWVLGSGVFKTGDMALGAGEFNAGPAGGFGWLGGGSFTSTPTTVPLPLALPQRFSGVSSQVSSSNSPSGSLSPCSPSPLGSKSGSASLTFSSVSWGCSGSGSSGSGHSKPISLQYRMRVGHLGRLGLLINLLFVNDSIRRSIHPCVSATGPTVPERQWKP